MRELKFRAWDKEYKKMWWFDLMWGNTVEHGSGWIGMVDSPKTEKYGEGILNDNRVQVDPIGKEIMQYTGLKDKNGKEIFEGDILKRIDGENRVIKWSKASHSFEWFSDILPNRFWNSDDSDWELSEIIGNLYQNPELIKP